MFTRIPFSPIRESLYSPQELMTGLDEADYRSFARTPDFKCFAYYVRHGRAAPKDPLSSIYEALHDNSITQATLAFLKNQKKVAAVMGGHDEPRNSRTYAAVARIARALSRKGFLMTRGGGPGAMEATHLGALLQAAGLLEKLFTRNNRGPDYRKYVLVTSDEQEAIDFLVANAPPANSHLRRLKSLGLLS